MQVNRFKSLIKESLKNFFLFLGLKINRRNSGLLAPKSTFVYQFEPIDIDRFNWMKTININTVIDVGAHLGEFSEQIYRILPNAKFYCFEPIRNNFIELTSNLNSENFKVFNIAVGDHQGNIEIYANNFSPSSSVLKLSDFHKAAFPFAANEQLEQIEINTLDAIFSNIELKENILLKIDVQGYEDRVIKGAKNLLERIKVIIVETSFRELYEGQVLFIDIYEILHQQGFVYSGSVGDLKNPVDGIPLQQDSLFIKQ